MTNVHKEGQTYPKHSFSRLFLLLWQQITWSLAKILWAMLCLSSFPCHGPCDDVKTIIVIVAHRARRGQGPWKHLTSYNQRKRIMWYIYQRKSHWSNKVIQGVWYLCSGLAALWDRFYIYISLTSGLLLLRCFHFAFKVSFCGRTQDKKKNWLYSNGLNLPAQRPNMAHETTSAGLPRTVRSRIFFLFSF